MLGTCAFGLRGNYGDGRSDGLSESVKAILVKISKKQEVRFLVEGNQKGYYAPIFYRKRVFSMYPDALSDSLSRLCDETGLTYEAASRHCRCSPQYFSAIIRRKSVPSIAILENLCDGFGKTPNCLLQVSPDTEENSYRTPMRVEAVRAFRWGGSFSAFPICPRCECTIEREYQGFCDRCGQRLSWKGFRRATVIMSPSETQTHKIF